MRCPYCGGSETKVLDKRETSDLISTRRRRECLKCKKRFTTYERVEIAELVVVKKDKRREPFDRTKLMKGIIKACEKRPVKMSQIEKAVDEIELELRKKEDIEVGSSEIGELVMSKLKQLDKIAYIRFASVYRDFTDVGQFKKELSALLKT
ncbi:transcriptional regulator NrdR [Candidatus Woesearchaeota archaeon]|nr:transcriptional regulator NrdR [Candidatus Woesearchaeota archaeon]